MDIICDNQDEDLRILKEAEEQYKNDHDDAKLKDVYEKVFVNGHSTLRSQTRWFKLVSLYIKLGEYDKAADWLERLSTEHSDYFDKIEGWYDKLEKKTGTVIDGSAHEYEIAAGDCKIVDTGYLAAMSDTCRLEVRTVPGLTNIFFGGEGVFNTVVSGPGKIILQSMPISSTAMKLYEYMPHPSNN